MKYQVIETRKFVAGSLEGLTIQHKTFTYDNAHDACLEANNRNGKDGGGFGFGSPYLITATKVVDLLTGEVIKS